MTKILALKSSIMGSNSQTNALIETFLAERKKQGLADQVVVHDLVALDLPVLDNEIFCPAGSGKFERTCSTRGGSI